MRNSWRSDRLTTGLMLALVALVIAASGILSRLDNVLADLGQRLSPQSPPTDIAIVAIDEASLARLGRWPWSRRLHATVIDRLVADGAKVIALDLVFAEPDAADPPADALLAEAVARARNVVLPVLIEARRSNGALIETLPLPQMFDAAAGLGRVHVELDADGIARSIYLWEGVGEPVWPHFAQAALDLAYGTRATPPTLANHDPYALARREPRRIRFTGPPGHIASLSYVQVLTGTFPPGTFRDKIVFIGATAAGLGDVLPTPVSGLAQPMPGVEIHANALHTLRSGQAIRSAAPGWVVAANLAIALVPLVWLARLGPLAGLLASLAAFVGVAVLAALLPLIAGWQVPLAGGLSSLLLAYPVWSWRRLDAASHFLDQELALLRAELGNAAPQAGSTHPSDRFSARIADVRAASVALKKLLDTRAETLAFISHDLRAPLAQARLQLGERAPDVAAALDRAHTLAEDFLHASRADMADASHFDELDFAAVVHQATDDAWSVAQAKSLALVRQLPDTPCWVRGDFGLLHRAVLNLILNAVKHAPAQSRVEVSLVAGVNGSRCSVVDHGAGITHDEQDRLFARGGTLAAGARAGGAGLGLYFVQTVVHKHAGRVEVTSEPGVRTEFSLTLPASFRHTDTAKLPLQPD